MPMSQCPVCSTIFHLNIGKQDLEKWYEKYWPHHKIGSMVGLDCFPCWNRRRILEDKERHKNEKTPDDVSR